MCAYDVKEARWKENQRGSIIALKNATPGIYYYDGEETGEWAPRTPRSSRQFNTASRVATRTPLLQYR